MTESKEIHEEEDDASSSLSLSPSPPLSSSSSPSSSSSSDESKQGGSESHEEKEKKESEDGEENEEDEEEDNADKKKKKKRKKKKTVGASSLAIYNWSELEILSQISSPSLYNSTAILPVLPQTPSPPTLPISSLYSSSLYPQGEIRAHAGVFNTFRMTSAEKKEKDARFNEKSLANIREAAEAHRQARADVQRWLRPGVKLLDVARRIESSTRALISGGQSLARGWAFPTGLSLNHCAAHFTPSSKDVSLCLTKDDVMKVDFGIQVDGLIVDCAFTVAFDPKYAPLLNAVRAATNAGIAAAGVDVRMSDIGEQIQEVMESYEIELNGKTLPIRSIRNLNGHSIGQYQIHGGKTVPIVKNHDHTKMEENEFYAIETFGSTGRGLVVEDMETSHYMKVYDHDTSAAIARLRSKNAKDVLKHIDTHHGTLAFCRRWLEEDGLTNHSIGLKQLCDNDIVRPYPPLCDTRGSFTAQYEHTLFLRPHCVEVVSRGDDY